MPAPNNTPLTDEQSEMVAENRGLAYRALRRYQASRPGRWGNTDDLLSAAFDGLIMAARGFDPARGWKFSTYAMRTMGRFLWMAEREMGLIRVPRYLLCRGAHPSRDRYQDDARRARRISRYDHSPRAYRSALDLPDRRAPRDEDARRGRELEALRDAIEALHEPLRSTMRLRAAGVPIREVAAIMRVGIRAIYLREGKAMQLLRDHIEHRLAAAS
jgi:RNA polymerase sigma factor (sigma-70 family)